LEGRSSLERTATATALLGIGIHEREAPLVDPLVEIERCAIEEEVALLVDNHIDAVLLGLRIGLGIPGGVEAERILKSAAAATRSTVA